MPNAMVLRMIKSVDVRVFKGTIESLPFGLVTGMLHICQVLSIRTASRTCFLRVTFRENEHTAFNMDEDKEKAEKLAAARRRVSVGLTVLK